MYKAKNLLSVMADAKTIKGNAKGILTGILYLAPHTLSGYQVCPKSTPECRAACLYTAGRGVYDKIKTARINKTVWFFEERFTFMTRLVQNVEALIRKAERMEMIPAVRLNGTSDIAWEKIACVRDGKIFRNMMLAFPDVQFYCYTKISGRKGAIALANYHLTFSLSENNDATAIKALTEGYNVAVVMNTRRHGPKPAQWSGYPVVDGDLNDIRFLDPKGGHIVALTAKGVARKMPLGFVRDVNSGFKTKVIPVNLAA